MTARDIAVFPEQARGRKSPGLLLLLCATCASLARLDEVASALGLDVLIVDDEIRLTLPAVSGRAVRGGVAPVGELGDVVARMRVAGDTLKRWGITRVGVFGSSADGRQRADSDVDLIIDMRDDGIPVAPLREYLSQVMAREVDITTTSRLRWEVRADIFREVVRVWAARLRNRIVHHYEGIDAAEIITVIRTDLPRLLGAIRPVQRELLEQWHRRQARLGQPGDW